MGTTGHNPYWLTWLFHSSTNPEILRLVERYLQRPAEELYHTSADRFEMTNLATDPTHAATKARLATELDRLQVDQKDPGIPLDTPEAHRAAADGHPLFPGKP